MMRAALRHLPTFFLIFLAPGSEGSSGNLRFHRPFSGPFVDVEDTHDYHGVMISVGTADLKAHLSEHLQAVRRGETIVVLDRREPIARIVPLGAAGLELVVRPANGALHEVPLPGPSRVGTDVLQQLREERAERL